MIYLKLLWSFTKIGFTSFGGLSMIPLITGEMVRNGWMTASEVSDIVAIAEMTPGPLGLNCATFAGLRTAGVLGTIAANLGVLMPTITIGIMAAAFFERFKSSTAMSHVMVGVRPACVGMIGGVMLSMCQENYVINGSVSFSTIVIGLLDLLLLVKFKLSVPKTIGISALLGMICFGALSL